MLMLSPSGSAGVRVCRIGSGAGTALDSYCYPRCPVTILSAKQPGASEKAGETSSPDVFKTGDRPFVTTWRTASPNESITIPVGGSTGAYTVDWGDGTVTSVTGDASHAYASPGEYQVVISGDFTRIYLNGSPDAEKLQSIDQWGDIQWESMNSAFRVAANMVYRATDIPDLSGVTDMDSQCSAMPLPSTATSPRMGRLGGQTDMSMHVRQCATSFNGDLSAWDVSNVQNMSCMFAVLQFSYVEVFSEDFAFAPPTSFDGNVSLRGTSRG